MPTRSNVEAKSDLPVYAAKRSKDWPAWALVTCPRCNETFLVKMSAWFKPRLSVIKKVVIYGRSCPYCFAASALPARRAVR